MTTRRAHRSDARKFLEELRGEPLSLGALLAAIREGEGWSQAHMGEVLGVSRAHVCDIEKGRRLVTPDRAVRWANKVGYGEKQQQGAYLGLEVLGFLGRWSSRLVSEVAQAAFLCPSLAVAHTVLGRWGLALDVKTLRGVCRALADRARSFRGEISLTGVWNAYGSCCPIVDELDTRLVAPMEMLPKLGQAFALVNRT